MDNTAILKSIRRMVMLFGTLLIVTIAVAGTNIYLTLAAPLSSLTAPTTVAFEGYLADGTGTPVPDAVYTITFRFYGLASGGTALWSEQQPVTVTNGLYSVQLGDDVGFPANIFDGPRWLSVQVDGNAEMAPRIPMSAVPWSFNAVQAQKALSLQGYEVADTAPEDGNALVWNETANKWEPQGVSGDASSLLGRPLDDQATPTAGQGLTWNGTDWLPLDVDAVKLQGLPIDAATPTAGQALTWDGANWVPAAPSGNATSLQNNPISESTPLTGQALTWSGSNWSPAASIANSMRYSDLPVSELSPNPGFETGSLVNWIPGNAPISGSAPWGAEASNPHSGIYRISGPGLSSITSGRIAISQNQQYLFGFWHSQTSTMFSPPLDVTLRWYNSPTTGSILRTDTFAPRWASLTWTQIRKLFVAPANAQSVEIMFTNRSGTASSRFYYDDVTLTLAQNRHLYFEPDLTLDVGAFVLPELPIKPTTPSIGQISLYGKNNSLYMLDSLGTETNIIQTMTDGYADGGVGVVVMEPQTIPGGSLTGGGHLHCDTTLHLTQASGTTGTFQFFVIYGTKQSLINISVPNAAVSARYLLDISVDINMFDIVIQYRRSNAVNSNIVTILDSATGAIWDTHTVDTQLDQTLSMNSGFTTVASNRGTKVTGIVCNGPFRDAPRSYFPPSSP